ncbi:MAG: uroporphyrinogen decarboxylase/cobalamine-independent methonine synthase family protein [Planctomycetota bacterium]|jgi:hypothetical protein
MDSGAFTNNPMLPADVVLAPAWWFYNEGLTFDEDFFYDPVRRVEVERKMEQALYEQWGRYGLGADRDKDLPVVGAVHLAAGYLLSEMLGCKVEYKQDAPPQVLCAKMDNLDISADAAFEGPAYRRFEQLAESLKAKYGYLTGDVNWGGILNIALDLRGEGVFMDMFDKPDEVRVFLGEIAKVIERFTQGLQKETGSTSISVNRNVRHLLKSLSESFDYFGDFTEEHQEISFYLRRAVEREIQVLRHSFLRQGPRPLRRGLRSARPGGFSRCGLGRGCGQAPTLSSKRVLEYPAQSCGDDRAEHRRDRGCNPQTRGRLGQSSTDGRVLHQH